MKSNVNKLIYITLILLLSGSSTVLGQVFKLKSTVFASRHQISDYEWSEWSEATEASVLMTIDLNNDRITIYSKVTQVFDIAEYEGQTTDADGDDVYSYFCVDQDGLTCRLKWMKLHSQNDRMQMYIYYSDLNVVYNVYSLN